MPRKAAKYHSLKKIRVRQDWSRWSLFHLANLRPPNVATRTYFQQKWTAKSETRAYHGEHIREKKWRRQFRRDLPAVVPMDHKYLARHDGSEQAAGRGAGADTQDKPRVPAMTPYMQMTYWPLERRLDTAIFRALFASSARQARQFVVHGLVKVNGKQMLYPGYNLNPGDMFQVEPSSVMFATGAPKTRSAVARRIAAEKRAASSEAYEKAKADKPSSTPPEPMPSRPEPTPAELKKHMQSIMESVKEVLESGVGAKDKQKLRDFRNTIRKAISLWRTASPESVSTLDTQYAFLQSRLSTPSTDASAPQTPGPPPTSLTDDETGQLKAAFDRLKAESDYDSTWNKRDASKPYMTPWRPRDYMNAFAFIPRYLEVNQNICAAVYLRHPVARPGLSEVPTPFPIETGQLAFNWYLRRR
ncbi:alpha-L RNA-binding motif-containing protein [Polyplosphaeria fusca]|uniref:Alpha-L RNA-binding motif-containing protein n=1 Tax=Polyplosphaeria fusca TaxID=682080 RepID=A0A9P4QR23_9PLEO|nr:alpha-L RNA-binding motif-containing protein [Polyplosphaeria fusca]